MSSLMGKTLPPPLAAAGRGPAALRRWVGRRQEQSGGVQQAAGGQGRVCTPNSPKEQHFAKGFGDATATRRENSLGLVLMIPLLCSLDPFLPASLVEDPGPNCCSFYLPV